MQRVGDEVLEDELGREAEETRAASAQPPPCRPRRGRQPRDRHARVKEVAHDASRDVVCDQQLQLPGQLAQENHQSCASIGQRVQCEVLVPRPVQRCVHLRVDGCHDPRDVGGCTPPHQARRRSGGSCKAWTGGRKVGSKRRRALGWAKARIYHVDLWLASP